MTRAAACSCPTGPFQDHAGGCSGPDRKSKLHKENLVSARISRRTQLELSFEQAVLQRVHTLIWPSIPCCSTHIVYSMTISDRNLHNIAAISRALSARNIHMNPLPENMRRGPSYCNLHKLEKLYHMRTEG